MAEGSRASKKILKQNRLKAKDVFLCPGEARETDIVIPYVILTSSLVTSVTFFCFQGYRLNRGREKQCRQVLDQRNQTYKVRLLI
jgi:hypothetical protein